MKTDNEIFNENFNKELDEKVKSDPQYILKNFKEILNTYKFDIEVTGEYDIIMIADFRAFNQDKGIRFIRECFNVFDYRREDFHRIRNWKYAFDDYWYSIENMVNGQVKLTKVKNDFMPPLHKLYDTNVEELWTYWNRALYGLNCFRYDIEKTYPNYKNQFEYENRKKYPELPEVGIDMDFTYLIATAIESYKACFIYLSGLQIQIETTTYGKVKPELPEFEPYPIEETTILKVQPKMNIQILPVEKWKPSDMARVLFELCRKSETQYSIAKKFHKILGLSFEQLKTPLYKAKNGTLTITEMDVEKGKTLMKEFLQSKGIKLF